MSLQYKFENYSGYKKKIHLNLHLHLQMKENIYIFFINYNYLLTPEHVISDRINRFHSSTKELKLKIKAKQKESVFQKKVLYTCIVVIKMFHEFGYKSFLRLFHKSRA